KVVDVTAAPRKQPIRSPLTAPIKRRDREPARAEVGYDLEILFDVLAASLKKADGTHSGSARSANGVPQSRYIARGQPVRAQAAGRPIALDRQQRRLASGNRRVAYARRRVPCSPHSVGGHASISLYDRRIGITRCPSRKPVRAMLQAV